LSRVSCLLAMVILLLSTRVCAVRRSRRESEAGSLLREAGAEEHSTHQSDERSHGGSDSPSGHSAADCAGRRADGRAALSARHQSAGGFMSAHPHLVHFRLVHALVLALMGHSVLQSIALDLCHLSRLLVALLWLRCFGCVALVALLWLRCFGCVGLVALLRLRVLGGGVVGGGLGSWWCAGVGGVARPRGWRSL